MQHFALGYMPHVCRTLHYVSVYTSSGWLPTQVRLITIGYFFPCLHEPGSVVIWEILYQPGLEIFSRPSKAMKSNISWRDLLRSYNYFPIMHIFSSTRLYPSLLKIYRVKVKPTRVCMKKLSKFWRRWTSPIRVGPGLEAGHLARRVDPAIV